MLSFRQKILFTYIIALLFFLLVMHPFTMHTINEIVKKGMESRATELIMRLQMAPNNEALIRTLKEEKYLIFFRVSIISNDRKVLYDSHMKRQLGPRFNQEYSVDHPEVIEAFKKGIGFNEEYSDTLNRKFANLAKSFDFHGKTYVMRMAFPYEYVLELTEDFQIGFLTLGAGFLLLFSILTWFIINQLTKPIQEIINAVTPYQQGLSKTIPEIILAQRNPNDDMSKLADTLNSLSAKIRHQISTLTIERNEKSVILESLVEGVVAVDDLMRVTYANQRALTFLGMENARLVGMPFSVANQQTCQHLLELCQKEHKQRNDTMKMLVGKQHLFLDLVVTPQKDGKGAVLVLQDKTSHYKILEMRKDFVANASHELKTPITIIRGFAETLQDNPDLPKEVGSDIMGKIVKNCQRMTGLIKDLLTLSDIENIPQSRLSECDVVDLTQECMTMIRNVYPDADMQIEKAKGEKEDEEYLMTADPNLLEMALLNLIENAVKYSKAPAYVRVVFAKDDEHLIVQVKDNGIGIPAQDVEHIFDRFYTVDKAHSQKMGGSGLGLSIVKTIVEKHGGVISVVSDSGGSIFTLIFPLDEIV